ncbi:hypothetical protein EJ03DRAFT_354563 [Teratosphaeria nubilosa]|uniref:Uncharacterized protein n=1 Tax=Teratosphaeria nubilosa TaxID=161662 RepID=A0A6G1KZB8_9PEZI|nr:hypothetical protein EJ03DRAFT_354563 [Teratosphaeria nubilosa]
MAYIASDLTDSSHRCLPVNDDLRKSLRYRARHIALPPRSSSTEIMHPRRTSPTDEYPGQKKKRLSEYALKVMPSIPQNRIMRKGLLYTTWAGNSRCARPAEAAFLRKGIIRHRFHRVIINPGLTIYPTHPALSHTILQHLRNLDLRVVVSDFRPTDRTELDRVRGVLPDIDRLPAIKSFSLTLRITSRTQFLASFLERGMSTRVEVVAKLIAAVRRLRVKEKLCGIGAWTYHDPCKEMSPVIIDADPTWGVTRSERGVVGREGDDSATENRAIATQMIRCLRAFIRL